MENRLRSTQREIQRMAADHQRMATHATPRQQAPKRITPIDFFCTLLIVLVLGALALAIGMKC